MFVVKFGKAIKNNPKKSVAAGVIIAWAGNWANKKHNAHLFRRAECQKAVKFGRESLNQFDSPKRVIVFLNPAANNGKASDMYQKYAAPILHLAGLNVHLVRLSYEGEAKKLMSVVDNADTDMIVCAGGDGTLGEIVTGLLRRPDSDWRKIPIAVLPLGQANTMSRRLLPDADWEKQPQFIANAAKAITHSITTPVDVMRVDGSEGKVVYAVSSIRWGTYCDLQERAKKFWYFGSLKSYMPFIFSMRKSDPYRPRAFNVSYTDAEDAPVIKEEPIGKNLKKTVSGTAILSNFFYRLWPWKSTVSSTSAVPDQANDNPPEIKCDLATTEWHELPINSIEFFAQANTHLNSGKREKASIDVLFESDTVTWKEFITKGPFNVQNVTHSPVNPHRNFEADSLKLSSVLSETEKQHIVIDNDRYEAMDIAVKLLPNCMKMVYLPGA